MKVDQIWLHPIKSCRGINVTSADYTSHGFILDRRWLIIDQKNKFQTARQSAKLVLIETKIAEEDLVITIPLESGDEEYSIPLFPTEDELEDLELVEGIEIWGSIVDGYVVSTELNAALSQFIGKPVRLVLKGPAHRATGEDQPAGPVEYDNLGVQYQDFYPFTLVTTSSLQSVREAITHSVHGHRLKIDNPDKDAWSKERINSVSVQRWRINIVIDGAQEAWIEDSWTEIQVGQAQKQTIYPVARVERCMVPNIDEQTGVRDSSIPWAVMQQFRIAEPSGSKNCFGMHCIMKSPAGTIRVGDPVEVSQTTDPKTRKGLDSS